MTKKEYFETIKEVVVESNANNKDDMLAFIDHEIELLNRKSSSKKPTEKQKENMGYKDVIRELLATNSTMTISQMMEDKRLEGLTNQRINGMLIQLGVKHGTGEVITTYVKGKAHYSLVGTEIETTMEEE